VVPIALLREWIAEFKSAVETDFWFGYAAALEEMSDFLDEFERTTNHNEGET
jgi:hypothetical protein